MKEVHNKMPAQRTRFDKDLMKLDEQLNIFFHQLDQSPDAEPFSERRRSES
ncbi:MAG: hypothetical protein ACLR6J_12285 [Parabacteroides merdae]